MSPAAGAKAEDNLVKAFIKLLLVIVRWCAATASWPQRVSDAGVGRS
jgi:hypothetical protein